MGSFSTTSTWIAGHLGELVGHKAGLALTRDELAAELLDAPDIREILLAAEDQWVTVRSEVYQEAVNVLLYRVGNIHTPDPLPPVATVFGRFANDPPHNEILGKVVTRCGELLEDEVAKTPPGWSLDPRTLLDIVAAEYGHPGLQIAYALMEAIVLQQHTSPWMPGRYFDWDDVVQLRDLFENENLETQYGAFFDQRYIDYLARNFQRIDEINWRKFEGLTGEFFERAGFQVEMGPGRADGGVDIRVWAGTQDMSKPPLILVQCKRQQKKVEQVFLKALWADVSDEGAQSGLIVTTSALTPSAETVRKGRQYPIETADRTSLKNWIKLLRSPGSGTFMA